MGLSNGQFKVRSSACSKVAWKGLRKAQSLRLTRIDRNVRAPLVDLPCFMALDLLQFSGNEPGNYL
jgi:hypothetical protein